MQGTIFEDKFLKPEVFWTSPWNVKKPEIKNFQRNSLDLHFIL